jgi:antitoxin component of RelBE/YafQ-DinJ toxin-antitoxin module
MAVALRFTVDDDLKADIEAYAKRYGISQADAARILIRKGVDAAKNAEPAS